MKCLKYFFVAGVACLSLSSASTKTSRLSEGIYPGNLFPDIKNLENESGTKINLSDLKGQKVLINLWAAYDAPSRKDNALFSKIIENKGYKVKMISISFDKSKSVFSRTLAIDHVDSSYQFMVDGKKSEELFDRYQLDKGFKNFLIDESGVISAIDLTSKDLEKLLK